MSSDDYSLLNDIHSYGINVNAREIYLHSHHSHGEEAGIEFKMATTFIKNLHVLEDSGSGPVLVHMHTVGGEWNDGIAIFNAIEFSPCPVMILVYGHAVSMGSIILQAAHKRILMPDIDFMIHFGEMSVEGHSLCVESSIKVSKKSNDKMLDIYSENCMHGAFFANYSANKVKEYLRNEINCRGDWWMDAEEAVYYGFADSVVGHKGYENLNVIRNTCLN